MHGSQERKEEKRKEKREKRKDKRREEKRREEENEMWQVAVPGVKNHSTQSVYRMS